MEEHFLIINSKALPDYFDKVLQAKTLLEQNQDMGVSDAVKAVGISRSTYYKYRDVVYSFSENRMGRKAVFTFLLSHEKGVLSGVLNELATCNANILTMNQSIPIHGHAAISITVELSELSCTIKELPNRLQHCHGVLNIRLIDLE